jgi:probable dihydroxyacetone kinase regulator
MIVDGADIRRPSFYNHFLDKYDLLEWIVATEVIEPARKALDAGQNEQAWRLFFTALLENEAFYRKAFSVTGQNGFEEAFVRQLTPLVKSYLAMDASQRTQPAPLSDEQMAVCYALAFSTGIKAWLLSNFETDIDSLLAIADYLISNAPKPPRTTPAV